MESEGVSLPLIHEHLLMPYNDMRRGDCCRLFKDITDGYYCRIWDFFFHKKCVESSKDIQHPSHPAHTLRLVKTNGNKCDLCWYPGNLFYHCEICEFDIDLKCIDYPPPDVIHVSKRHQHKLTLLKEKDTEFDCDAQCGKSSYGFPYKCHECDISFHVDCVWDPSEVNFPLEVNHSYHSKHPLKLFKGQTPPAYSDGKCSLCERKIDDEMFYHCSSTKFNLDLRCVLNPPPQSFLDLKTHDHLLTLLPRLDSFTCNACGLKGDRSPYICVQCGFMIHQGCVGLPRVIQINRHGHRVSRTCVLGVVDSVCGVCRQKVDWSFGGYSCQKCPDYVVHSKCATREDVWNGIELEDVPEETEDIEPYVIIDDNTIQHFSHKEHHLRLNVNDLLWDNNKRCRACTHPICLQSFYCCLDCDFILHDSCANLRTRIPHVLHNDRLTLVTSVDNWFWCEACDRISNGFLYTQGNKKLDVFCGSISEPFVHSSHPHHPLYYILPTEENEICSGCNEKEPNMLRCIEDGCGYKLGFKCATLPKVVKHRVDDHPLSLFFGEEASGKYWCDICEKETNPKTWFYTSKDNRASLHIECVLGDFAWHIPERLDDDMRPQVVLNNSVSRPFCKSCKSHCIPTLILKVFGNPDKYFCSLNCCKE